VLVGSKSGYDGTILVANDYTPTLVISYSAKSGETDRTREQTDSKKSDLKEKRSWTETMPTGFVRRRKAMTSNETRDIDPRVYLLISILTLGLGLTFIVLYIKTPTIKEMERTLYMIGASALLPAGLLWTIEHYFLTRPLEHEYETALKRCRDGYEAVLKEHYDGYETVLKKYRDDQYLMETIQSAEKHNLRAISAERAPLVKRVLEGALDDEACREIIVAGSTLDGLFRQGAWFEEFTRIALAKEKKLRLMFTHWDYVTHREKQEDRADGDIAGELKQSLARFLLWGVPSESIRLVRGAPTVFMIIAGSNMILNPYTFGREAVTSTTFWFTNPDSSQREGPPGTIWHTYYSNHYDIMWNPDKYPRQLNASPEPISSPLPDDWREQIDRFVDGVIRARGRPSGTQT
jgi:hypothetical protein